MNNSASTGSIAAGRASQAAPEPLHTTLRDAPRAIFMKLYQTGAGGVLREADYMECEKESIGRYVK
jgi:hypothetical protein